jgi:hypothetical protein
VTQPRLILFLADIEGSLPSLRQTVSRACEEFDVPAPEVRWVESATALADAGWRVAELKRSNTGGHAVPEEHLEALVRAVARDTRDQVVGLYADKAGSYGRASLSEPGRPSRFLEGEYLETLRQVSRWLRAELAVLGRLLEGDMARNLLAATVDFGGEPERSPAPSPVPPEPDEDDRSVEAKLAEARRLMEQYLNQRK